MSASPSRRWPPPWSLAYECASSCLAGSLPGFQPAIRRCRRRAHPAYCPSGTRPVRRGAAALATAHNGKEVHWPGAVHVQLYPALLTAPLQIPANGDLTKAKAVRASWAHACSTAAHKRM